MPKVIAKCSFEGREIGEVDYSVDEKHVHGETGVPNVCYSLYRVVQNLEEQIIVHN